MIVLSRREKIFCIFASLFALLFIGVVWWVNRPKENEATLIVVQIEGEVHHPGVYRVAEGTRVYELIEHAGGTKKEANLQGLNLAAPLYDGQKIFIPPMALSEEGQAMPSTLRNASSSHLINVNTASQQELESLPGIGEILAQRIVEYRTQNGPFRSPEDLLKVKGIGPKKLEALRDRITF